MRLSFFKLKLEDSIFLGSVFIAAEATELLLGATTGAALLLKNFLLGGTAGASIVSGAFCGSSTAIFVFTGSGTGLAVSSEGGLAANPPRSRRFVGGGTLVSSK